MRHEFFDAVLTKKETVDYVIANLKAALIWIIYVLFTSNSTKFSQYATIKSL
jgi:hypothetical protein